MSDKERPRDSRREPRSRAHDHTLQSTSQHERRNRSRSPRRDGARYRSRSPFRRDDRSDRDSGRGGRGRGDRGDRGAPPRGPRNTTTGSSNANLTPRPAAKRSPSPSASVKAASTNTNTDTDTPMREARSQPADMDDETWALAQTMGFAGFKSTKNTKVPGNDKNFGVRRDKQMEARQYMNRQGGFNRPLSPGRR